MRKKGMLLQIVLIFFLIYHLSSIVLASSEFERKAVINDKTEKIVLDSIIEILEDKDRSYTIEDVSTGLYDDQFELYKQKGRPNFGYTNSAYWVRFEIDNRSTIEDWLLELDTPKLNRITLYEEFYGGYIHEREVGNMFPFSEREVNHRNFIYDMNLPSSEKTSIYLRVVTGGSMQLPLTLWDSAAHSEKSQIEYIFFGMITGISIVMALYNLFLFFTVGDRSYLYYVFFVVCNSLLSLSDTGLAYQFIWPDSVGLNLRAVLSLMCLSSIGGLLFTRSFLETAKFQPHLDKCFKILVMLNIVMIVWGVFTFRGAVISTIATIISVLITVGFIVIAIIFSLRQKYRPARFLAVAWGIFLTGVSISLLVDAGIVTLSLSTKYAWQITTALEVVLLSFALGDKVKAIRAEKDKAIRESRDNQERALKNLMKADKLKDEFLASTSHELRTPLHGIIGIAETLRDGVVGEVSPDVRHQLSMIITSGNRLSNLVNEILDFSKLRNNDIKLKLEAVNLHELTDVVLTVCRPLTRNKFINLKNEIDTSTPYVLADVDRLQQIMYNLIGNAIKFTDSGLVTVMAEEEDGFIQINVIDTGKGIKSQDIENVFNPFHQGTDQIEGGMGIGLSVTKRLVQLHNGHIDVTSKVGSGTVFSFTLPVASGAKSSVVLIESQSREISDVYDQKDTWETSSTSENKKEAKVLIADDERINVQVLMNHLTLEGYEVTAVSNGKEVIEKVQNETFDLIILDVMMPRMSGYEVCHTLRKEYSLMELPILMLTARTQQIDKVTAFEVGANDYLAKPCDRRELLSRVKTLVQLRHLTVELNEINRSLEDKIFERTQEIEAINRELAKKNEELISVEQSRSHLLANISHELGTPVTLIQSYIQAVQEGIIKGGEQKYIKMIDDKVNLLERLIYDLSDLSRIEEEQLGLVLAEVNLGEWYSEITERFSLEVMHGKRNFLYDHQEISRLYNYICFIDLERMDQVISNIVWNAINHTEQDKGTITMKANVDEQNEKVIISIQDNGIGIDEDILPHIFERFFTATVSDKEDEKGTGLGLVIVKELVHAHKGTITVESERHRGSTFSLTLPIWYNHSS